MRQLHRAGEKLFVDYAGHKPKIVDRSTGEVREVIGYTPHPERNNRKEFYMPQRVDPTLLEELIQQGLDEEGNVLGSLKPTGIVPAFRKTLASKSSIRWPVS